MLDRGDLIEVFKSFLKFETAHPRVARVQTLVTVALPQRCHGSHAIRDVFGVHDRFTNRSLTFALRATTSCGPISSASSANHLGISLPTLSRFRHAPFATALRAEASFSAALHHEFPELDVSGRKAGMAFAALSDLISQRRGVMLSRSLLLDTLRDSLGTELIPDRSLLRMHVRSDRNGEMPDAIEIEGSAFSGGSAGFPEAETLAN